MLFLQTNKTPGQNPHSTSLIALLMNRHCTVFSYDGFKITWYPFQEFS